MSDVARCGLVYRQFAPCRALAPHVACYWTITPTAGGGAGRIRVVPDCCMDAVFDLSGGLARPGLERPGQASAFMVGASLEPLVIGLDPGLRVAGIRFLPGGAAPFLGPPAFELTGRRVSLSDLLPGFSSLGLSLAGEASTPRSMAAVLERLLLERLAGAAGSDVLTGRAVSALSRPGPESRVEAVAASLGQGRRRLERLLRRQTGLAPKEFGRAARFVRAVRALDAGAPGSLAGLALALGFADQAHFNREFKALSGLTPMAWLVERRDVAFVQYALAPIG